MGSNESRLHFQIRSIQILLQSTCINGFMEGAKAVPGFALFAACSDDLTWYSWPIQLHANKLKFCHFIGLQLSKPLPTQRAPETQLTGGLETHLEDSPPHLSPTWIDSHVSFVAAPNSM
jgi:hypothetical protein